MDRRIGKGPASGHFKPEISDVKIQCGKNHLGCLVYNENCWTEPTRESYSATFMNLLSTAIQGDSGVGESLFAN